MKKFISVICLTFTLFFAYSLSMEQAEDFLRENDVTWDIVEKKITNVLNSNNDTFIAAEEDAFTAYLYYISENQLVRKYPCTNLSENKKLRNLGSFKLKNTDSFLADFNYDEENDLIIGSLSSHYYSLNIYNYKKNSDSILTLVINNKDFIDDDYSIIFEKLSFCIINGKRGIKLSSIDYLVLRDGEVHIGLKENTDDFFLYWSSSAGRYILDENVTKDQLKNAYCPADYFAYNDLKFSKLDSKLTEEDLKDLDKSQLRLMRNAIYARHGRTFKSVDLQSLWECYTWYEKNPNYSDDLLTDTDKYNIELIQKFEFHL